MKQQFSIVLFLTLLALYNAKLDLVLFDNSNYPEALCVDGSHAGFYYQKGWDDGSDKFIIYFQSGGACFAPTKQLALASCYDRSFSELGSSKYWSQTRSGAGILQESEDENPYFYNWNKVFVPYCDGLVHQGHYDGYYEFLTKKLYFRGLDNTMSTFQYLIDHYGLATSAISQVLLTGASAGGIGVFYYADILKNMLPASTKYWVAPDSGFFINYYYDNPNNFFIECIDSMLDLVDRSKVLPQGCAGINGSEAYKCVVPQYWIQDIKSDLYIIQSAYDSFTLQVFLGIECISSNGDMSDCSPEKQATIQNFRNVMLDDIYNIIYDKSNANAWVISCIQHTFIESNGTFDTTKFEVPARSGNTSWQALYEWMYASAGKRKNSIDQYAWPLNQPCNGLNSDQHIYSTIAE